MASQYSVHHETRICYPRGNQWREAWVVFSALLFVVLLLCICCGCSSTRQRRADSLAALKLPPAQQERLVQGVLARTVYLERWQSGIACGTGVILTEDGYLLTAAHCLSADPHPAHQFIALPDDPEGLLWIPIRRVWVGSEDGAAGDFAVLKVDRTGLTPFQWCAEADVRAGAAVVAAGSHQTDSHSYVSFVGGRVSEASVQDRVQAGSHSLLFGIDAPLGPGDSGGPVVTTDGRLIGIATRRWTSTGLVTVVRPNPDWLNRLIEEDRRTLPATQPSWPLMTIRRPSPESRGTPSR